MDEDKDAGRSTERFKASLPARLLHQGREYPCSAHDLSRSGVLLRGDLPHPESPDVEVIISTAGDDLELRITAALVHVQQSAKDGQTGLGLQFGELNAKQRTTVESMVYRVMEGMAPAALEALGEKASLSEIRQALNNIPLPHRIMLARRGQLKERTIIRNDSNPEVLEALARNPNILMPEILVLARVRHLAPSTVTILAGDPRWAGNEELKIMLATHPRVTFPTADKIVDTLSEAAQQRVIRRPGLHPGVKQKLMVKFSRKSGRF